MNQDGVPLSKLRKVKNLIFRFIIIILFQNINESMNLFKFRLSKKLKVSWIYYSKDQIWRVYPAGDGILVGEVRNTTEKSVSFFCIHLKAGIVLWEGLRFEEKWWIGIESVFNNVVIFHEFATPELPEHFKIRAVDCRSGKKLWENDEVQFVSGKGDFVYVAKMGLREKKFYEMELRTGEIRKEISADGIPSLGSNDLEAVDDIQFPNGVFDEDQRTNLLQMIPVNDSKKIGYAEYIKKNNLLLIGYYHHSNNSDPSKFDHSLLVVDENKKPIYNDTIDVGVHYPSADGFLCIGETLVYVKNRNELVTVDLKGEK